MKFRKRTKPTASECVIILVLFTMLIGLPLEGALNTTNELSRGILIGVAMTVAGVLVGALVWDRFYVSIFVEDHDVVVRSPISERRFRIPDDVSEVVMHPTFCNVTFQKDSKRFTFNEATYLQPEEENPLTDLLNEIRQKESDNSV